MKADGKTVIVNQHGKTVDIMQEVIAVFESYKHQTASFAKQFKGATDESTARNIFRYIKRHVAYVLDKPGEQLVKTPARTVADGYADCKGYSILAASLLDSLGMGAALRFVSFSKARPEPTHVYVVATGRNGKEWIIDVCTGQFDTEKPYQFKYDYMTQISRLSGLQGSADFFYSKPVKTEHGYYYDPYIGRTIFGKILSTAGQVYGGVTKALAPVAGKVADSFVPGSGQVVTQLQTAKGDLLLNLSTRTTTAPQPTAPTGSTSPLASSLSTMGTRLQASTLPGATAQATQPQGSNTLLTGNSSTMLMLGGLGLAAYFLMQNKGKKKK